jgi:hypothetical protein
MDEQAVSEQLLEFLRLVDRVQFRRVPNVWNEQQREALSGRLVTVGWGGVLQLTAAGRACLKASDNQ